MPKITSKEAHKMMRENFEIEIREVSKFVMISESPLQTDGDGAYKDQDISLLYAIFLAGASSFMRVDVAVRESLSKDTPAITTPMGADA